jgi:DNA-binding NarL/FixJ family response regulator
MTDQIRIIVVDDHPVVRRGISDVLSASGQISVVGEASNGRDALDICACLTPDIVIMDVRMKGIDGIETTRALKRNRPGIRVIALSTFAHDDVVQAMKDAGASGYLLKELSAAELVDATVRIHNGGSVFFEAEGPAPGTEMDVPGAQDVGSRVEYNIGSQQKKVLWLLTKGLTNGEIADHLQISLPTARYHVSALLQKLEVSNRAEAVALALREGLV